MSEEAGAKKAEEVSAQPPGSQPEKVQEGIGQPQTPPDGASIAAAGKVPFHEIMSNPDFQDYFNRQLDKRVEEKLSKLGVTSKLQSGEPDEMDLIAKNLSSEFQMTEDQAKGLLKHFARIAELQVKPLQGAVQEQKKNTILTARYAALRVKYPDAEQLQGRMVKLMGEMDETTANFILNSPDGMEYLYGKAKQGWVASTPEQKAAASSTSGRSLSPVAKIGDKGSATDDAVQSLVGGNREDYERKFQALTSK